MLTTVKAKPAIEQQVMRRTAIEDDGAVSF
jgi:hypothetical protein